MTLPKQATTREQMRRSIGYNLGDIIVGVVTDTKDSHSLWDTVYLAKGGDDEYNGRQVIIYDSTGGTIVDGEVSWVSDFDSTNKDATMSPVFTANLTALDKYEMWRNETIEYVNDMINQAIIAATDDCVTDQVDETTLVKLENVYEYTIPSGFVGIHTIEYEKGTGVSVELDDCDTVWTAGSANVTVTADTAFEKEGTACAKLVEDGNSAAGAKLGYNVMSAKDISGCDRVEFWMYSSIALTAGQLDFVLSASAAIAATTESIDIPAMTANTWYRHCLTLANPQSDTAIISIGIIQTTDVGAATYYVDEVRALKDRSREYVEINPEHWGITQGSTNYLQFDNTAYSMMNQSSRIRISGYAIPALLAADITPCTVDPDYVIMKATGMILSAGGGGRFEEEKDRQKAADRWLGFAERRLIQASTSIEMNTRWVT